MAAETQVWDPEGKTFMPTETHLWVPDTKLWNPPLEVEFDPASIPDLHIYLDGDTLAGGDTPSTWDDSSGLHNDLTTAGFFNAPLVLDAGLNGHNTVRFGSVEESAMRWQGMGLSGDYHVFTVARMIAGQPARLIGSIYPDNANFTAGWHGGNEAAFYNGSVFLAGGGQARTLNIWRRMEMSGPTLTEGRMNGSVWGTSAGGSTFNGGVALSGYGMATTSELSDFEIACTLIYARVLNSIERETIDEWLVSRFAL